MSDYHKNRRFVIVDPCDNKTETAIKKYITLKENKRDSKKLITAKVFRKFGIKIIIINNFLNLKP